MYVYICIYIHV
jgi:hypothetical protein